MRTLILPNMDCDIHTHLLNDEFIQKLNFAKTRVDCLNAYRIEQALINSSEQFQLVFSLLPVLVHYNISSLPSYIENAPCGIVHFQISELQQRYLASFSEHLPIHSPDSPAFDGLYAMGSIGSITQTTRSDLDLWLCYSREFSAEQHRLIQQKLLLIKLWAADLGVEINFFLMNPQAFIAQRYNSGVTEEHNGSAQHFFLLDEFYRSAVRLAGKRILWSHIAENQQDYQTVVQCAVQAGQLNLSEWIDFGDFSSLSIDEYFGASLWQLYKGTKSPYKSAIKILLLESYAETYPKTNLISKKFKQLLLSEKSVDYHFDPYLAMLAQVTHYLENRKELARLNRLRKCFYIKSNEGQDDPLRKNALRRLAVQWGWDERELTLLDNRPHWKIKQGMRYQRMLVEQLLQSYRNLIQFARKFQIDPSIMPQDIDMIMRKLYLEFEPQPGKIFLINEKIASNLAEPAVTFIEVKTSSSAELGWYMINHAPHSAYDSAYRHIQYQSNLIQLIAWAYFNGVITANTDISLVSSSISLATLRQFITDLRLSFPVKSPTMVGEALYHPNEIRNLIVAVNLVNDPSPHYHLLNGVSVSQMDLLNLTSSETSMIGSISIIYRNMWNEILTQHFEGSNVLLKALKFISNKIYRSSAPPHSVNVFGYSQQFNDELRDAVLNLVDRCITVQTGSIYQRQQSLGLQMIGKKWQSVFETAVQAVEKIQDFTCRQPLIVPKEVYNFASEGFLQFFFEDSENGAFNVYILDKKNQTECYRDCLGNKEACIKQIGRLYSQHIHLQENCAGSFNFPQFYQLLRADDLTFIVPFQSKQHRDFLALHKM